MITIEIINLLLTLILLICFLVLTFQVSKLIALIKQLLEKSSNPDQVEPSLDNLFDIPEDSEDEEEPEEEENPEEPNEDVEEEIPEKDRTEYLDYLTKLQIKGEPIWKCRERIIHSYGDSITDAYIFKIKDNGKQVCMVYESVDVRAASYFIFIEKENEKRAFDAIVRFFTGNISNKRQFLMDHPHYFVDDGVYKLVRKLHNNYDSWTADLRWYQTYYVKS